MALGISLGVVEQQFGWNLRQAGPFAVLIALLLIGFLILHVLLRIHVSWQLAVPLTYVLVYLLVRAMSPSLFELIATRMPFINLLTALIFLIAVWQVGVAIWPTGQSAASSGASNFSFVAGLSRKDEKRELKVEKQLKRKLTPEVKRETKRIEHRLEAIQKELRREHPDWNAIA